MSPANPDQSGVAPEPAGQDDDPAEVEGTGAAGAAAAPEQGEDARSIGQLVEEYLRLSEVPEKTRDEAWQEAERACREGINRRYWNRLFSRLGEVVAASPSDELKFGAEDAGLFDFGWLDERLFPAAGLTPDEYRDELYRIMDLRQYLAAADAEFMLVPERAKLSAGITEVTGKLQALAGVVAETMAARDREQAALPDLSRGSLAELNRVVDSSTVTLIVLERLKKNKGLGGDQVKAYGQLRSQNETASSRRETTLLRLGEAGKRLAAANRKLFDSRNMAVQLADVMDRLKTALAAAEAETVNRRVQRRATLEERLGEIREDIVMCGRWGRTTASPALLQNRGLNGKEAVIDSIRRVEDFDPGLFANRRVERGGRPRVVLTPGIGNGSYDFRSNVLIVPRTSPRSTLESVAFALALYRRDQDKACDEGRLWRSFLEDIAWSKMGGAPRSVQAQMRTFVRAYTTWATREAAGQPVLQPELRVWFEEKIAPSTRGPVFPRDMRGIGPTRRDELLAAEEAAGAEGDRYRMGCLFWMKDDFARALESFRLAAEVLPVRPEAFWSVAACLRLPPEVFSLPIGMPERLGQAIEALHRFTAQAGQSWWTRRAQGIASELQARLDEMRRG